MFEKRSCKFVSADGNFHGSEVCLGGDGDLYPGLQHDFVEFGMFWPQPSNVKAWRVMLVIFGGSNHLQVCLAVSHSITPVVITSYPFTLSRFKEFGNNYIVSYCSYGFILFHVVPLGVQHDFATFAHFSQNSTLSLIECLWSLPSSMVGDFGALCAGTQLEMPFGTVPGRSMFSYLESNQWPWLLMNSHMTWLQWFTLAPIQLGLQP